MTEDVKATRLSKAAREFNVGISTIVEFLHKKGFVLDPNPNTKLPHEAYLLLVKEYSTDISAKKESEKLILKDLHRKKESVSIDDFSEKSPSEDIERDEEVLVKDSSVIKKGVDIKTEISKPDIKLVGKIDLDKATRPKTEKPASQKEVQEEKPAPKPVGPEKEKTTPKKEEKKVPIDLHIVGKIDLGTIAKEGKPAAEEELTKHPIEKAVEQKEEIVEKGQKKREPIEEPVAPLTDEEVTQRDYSEIENIEKAGPIAIADHFVLNNGTFEELRKQVQEYIDTITS